LILSGGAAAHALASLLALETGGIVDKDQLVRIGEGNKKEAVIPLENSTYMRPFSAAVANDLAQMMEANFNSGRSSGGPGLTVNIGTLIGDERSIKELYRRLYQIGLTEGTRRGDS